MNPDTLRQLLTDGDWRTLFVNELGWNRCSTRVELVFFDPGQQTRGWASLEERKRRETLTRHTFVLQAIAQKCGIAVFVCSSNRRDQIPPYVIRCDIERRLCRSNHHHLIVFTGAAHTKQIWQWSYRTEDGCAEYYEHTFEFYQPDEEFIRRLAAVSFSFEEEESLTLVNVLRRVHAAFYFARPKFIASRVRLHGHNLSEFSEVVQAWTKQAYAERGLTWAEERRLGHASQAGSQAAQERLVKTHLYLPLEMAWKLKEQRGLTGVELEDLIHEGYFGLQQAVSTFEPASGLRFQAHAGRRVRNFLERAISHWGRLIAVPNYIEFNLQYAANNYAAIEDRLFQILHRKPSREEMARGLGISLKSMSDLDMVRSEFVSLERLHEQQEDCDDFNFDLAEILSLSEIEGIVIEANGWSSAAHAMEILKELTARERSVIVMRYGLCGNEVATLGEVGLRLRITQERVRQIEMRAVKKLRLRFASPLETGREPDDTADLQGVSTDAKS